MVLIALCVAVELTGNTLASLRNLDKEMHFEKRSTYASYYKQGNKLKNALKKAGAEDTDLKSDEFFRVENSRARNANDGMSSGYNAISHYSSFSRRDTFRFLKKCGMMCLSQNKIFRYYGSTSALDSILGVRYVFSEYERRSGYIDTGLDANGLKLWKNINSLPLTFFADGAILDMKTGGSPFDCLNQFLNSFDKIQRTYYTPLVVTDSIDGGEIKKTRTRNQVVADTSSTLKFTISNPRAQHVLIYFDNNIPEFTAVYLNGERLNFQNERLIRGVIELGFLPQGDAVVSLSVSGNTRWYSGLCAASFNTEEFDQLISTLRKSAPKAVTVSKTLWGNPVVSGKFNAPRNGALFTSIPADGGWSAEIDGHKVTPIAAENAFIAIPVTSGEHMFKLHYRQKGLAAGILTSAATAILCLVLLVLKQYRKRH